ncbi:hypothetical protein B0H11DRAFT_515818 [Mycena galericulata]|nr:hypothetical protein B0H11DRAFT_515818 [Mycena galericulata]
MAFGPTFTGSGTSAAEAINFLKDVHLGFGGGRTTMTDAEKLEEISYRFRHATPADVWFRARAFTKWSDFVTEFEQRFAGMQTIVKPRAQLLAELSGMRITVVELAAGHVLVGGEKVAPMVAFHARVKEAVMDANAGKESEGVWSFHAALPAAVKLSIGSAPATWTDMLAALNAVPENAIAMEVAEHNRKTAFDSTMGQLAQLMRGVRVAIPPTVAAAGAGGNGGVANAGAPAVATPAAAANGGTGGGGGRGAGGGRAREGIPPGTDAQKTRLRQLMQDGNRLQPADTPEGRATYVTQIAEWTTRNGHIPPESLAISSTGYPLTPGTSVPCSGECWRCGMRTWPPHRTCTAPLVPPLERRYRATCGSWFGRIHEATGAVNYVEVVEVEGVPWCGGAEEGGANGGEEGF